MKTAVTGGIVLGILVGLWTFVMGFTGWYKDPVLLNAFFLVILIQIGVLVWGLRRGATEGRRYGGQVGLGVLISLIGGVIIIFSSLLFTTIVFPDYFNELRALHEQMLQQAGKSASEIQAEVALVARTQTPAIQAFAGFAGTMVTGLVVSLITAIFVRAR
jgi:hypothetical protein